jgi:flagellar protein FlaG
MQDVNQVALQGSPSGARAVVTDVVRKDAMTGGAGAAHSAPASVGRGSGKPLPPLSDPETAQRRQQVVANSRQHVERAIAHLNDYVQSIQRDLQFSMDEGSGKSIVQVIDRSTQQVVRQIPSEVALQLARNLNVQQMQSAGEANGSLGLIDTRI